MAKGGLLACLENALSMRFCVFLRPLRCFYAFSEFFRVVGIGTLGFAQVDISSEDGRIVAARNRIVAARNRIVAAVISDVACESGSLRRRRCPEGRRKSPEIRAAEVVILATSSCGVCPSASPSAILSFPFCPWPYRMGAGGVWHSLCIFSGHNQIIQNTTYKYETDSPCRPRDHQARAC